MKTAEIGHDTHGNVVVHFEPDDPKGWYVIFTPQEAEAFAHTILARAVRVNKGHVEPLRQHSARYVQHVLDQHEGNKRAACRALGISYHTLNSYLARLTVSTEVH